MKLIEQEVARVTGLTLEQAVARVGDEAGAEVEEIHSSGGVHVWRVIGCAEVHYLECPTGFETTSDIETDFPSLDL